MAAKSGSYVTISLLGCIPKSLLELTPRPLGLTLSALSSQYSVGLSNGAVFSRAPVNSTRSFDNYQSNPVITNQ